MIIKRLLPLLFISGYSFAEEATVEVGKHATPNIDALSMIMSLLMVLVLIIAGAWVLKKFNVVNRSVSGMKVISSLPIGHKEKLIVVQVGEEQLLLGVSAHQVNLIKKLDEPIEIKDSIAPEFSQSIANYLTKTSNKSG